MMPNLHLTPTAGAAAAPLSSGPLRGKVVLLVHPAWHSCGSHKVFVSQARAYRSLGAEVLSLAVADAPGATPGSRTHKSYVAATEDLEADARFFAGMLWRAVASRSFLRAVEQWLHGNFAHMLVETTKLVTIPDGLFKIPAIDLIHCNHFFCMPAATRLAEGRRCPILLDTHDLQARQYVLRNQSGWTLPVTARYEDMLEFELSCMRQADVLIHLNDEEATTFEKLLPDKRHALLYPAVPPIEPGPGGEDLIIVASANYANFVGLVWFLTEVLPLAPDVSVQILGNIDREVRRRAPKLFKRYAALFRGRVEDLDAAYARAAAVLLPTTRGHGISIKTIEAMSSGAPLIATPHAFRGLSLDLAALGNVTLAANAAAFAAALRCAAARPEGPPPSRFDADTRRAYGRAFAFDPYRTGLAAVAEPLIDGRHLAGRHLAGRR